MRHLPSATILALPATLLPACADRSSIDWSPASVHYTIRFPDPAQHAAEIQAVFPSSGQATDLFMPTWSPGCYQTQEYAKQVRDLTPASGDGKPLAVDHPKPNRWHIPAHPAGRLTVTYLLNCQDRFVTTNWVGEDYAILNGPATFISMPGDGRRPCAVKIDLPPTWKQSFSGMPSSTPNLFRAADYDQLADCPIAAGNFETREFTEGGKPHRIVNIGDQGTWKSDRAAADLQKIVAENNRFWGALPYHSYTFLLAFRPGGGGLEHSSSTLATTNPRTMEKPQAYTGWLGFISHEYFHAFNVKRLRPVELGPFDYESPPRTASLWISEGLTNYYGELLVTRAGLAPPDGFLTQLSSHIHNLQFAPGRLVQTLERSSLDVWESSTSGVQGDTSKTVNYYEKGPVVGFLLDARIRRATANAKSLDDVMRLAYQRFSGDRGFTADQFRQTVEEVAGADLKEFFRTALQTTQELDYTEALDWFGLRFEPPSESGDPPSWKLEARKDATQAQRDRRSAWLSGKADSH